MNRAGTTYWDDKKAAERLPKSRKSAQLRKRTSATPQWFVFAVLIMMTFMLCIAINLRAFAELNAEIDLNQKLSSEVDQLADRNIAIQEEIHSLKTDPNTIEREARKLGMGRSNEKIFVPAK